VLKVRWLLQRASDVPDLDDWLSPAERDAQAGLRFPGRRREWRLGRWTAKRALALAGALADTGDGAGSLAHMSIEATDAGAPLARMDGAPAPWTISLSHSREYGLCALAAGRVAIGCDIEAAGRRGESLVAESFTTSERAQVAELDGNHRSHGVALIWSAKESALKALGTGLRVNPRDVDVVLSGNRPSGGAWRPLEVRTASSCFCGWWQAMGESVITLVADPPPDVPEGLDQASLQPDRPSALSPKP
jgi:4'-phosphopantetheinyl transferase